MLYVYYFIILSRLHRGSILLSPGHISAFLQCITICTVNFVCAMLYVCMEFFPTPNYFVYVGHATWQLGNGKLGRLFFESFPAVAYLLLNRTIRTEVLSMLQLRRSGMMSAKTAWPPTDCTSRNVTVA
ncbi:hypothetical protein OESDEN_06954 [Oesophagostomum dentatum]|uniref:7TM GPCR serpentine receptor class x (Srx) domain-containing protein n=1 Tax=Oesophagostomum dentatum TaxID=61180 RepID=A0A0B1T6J2_OESDE|nr:hypothetical protein OESDEN_06954 [Oesophagostomum dentatum]